MSHVRAKVQELWDEGYRGIEILAHFSDDICGRQWAENELRSLERRKGLEQERVCPECQSESTGEILYSNPPQTRCQDCGHLWDLGPLSLSLLTREEALQVRPGFDWSGHERERADPDAGEDEPGVTSGDHG